MCTFDEICNVGNIPMLREEAALDICAWKAEHEDVYAEFKKKMDDIGTGDTSALESMFDLVCDCLSVVRIRCAMAASHLRCLCRRISIIPVRPDG